MNGFTTPSDNIYKFYAIAGLILFMASVVGLIDTLRYSHDSMYSYLVEKDRIERGGVSPENVMPLRDVQDARYDVAVKNKDDIGTALTLFGVLSLFLSITGFTIWQNKIQPQHDELLELQLREARFRVAKLEASDA